MIHARSARLGLACSLVTALAFLAGCAANRAAPVAADTAIDPGETPPAAEVRPTGADVIARYVDATGGREAYEQLESRITKGSFEGRVLFLTVSGSFTTWQKHPRMLRTEARAKLLGRELAFIAATDGVNAWQGSGADDIKMLDGPRRDSFIRQADLRLVLSPETQYPTIEYKDDESFNGVTCRRVELQTREGDTETRYYAIDSGLLNGLTARRKGANDSFVVRVTEYRDVGGIKEPTRFEFSILGGGVSWVNESIEHNVTIDNGLFAPPAPRSTAPKNAD